MTTRERNLSIVLGSTLGVLALGFFAYQFVYSPLKDKNAQITKLQDDIDLRELEIAMIGKLKRDYEWARQQSLPADVGTSRSDYSTLLESLIRKADFVPGVTKITPADPDSKTPPKLTPTSKKTAYTRLNFEVTVRGDVYHLVDFMRNFYAQPLLHTIRKMNIQRPSDAMSRNRKELDVTFTVEALVLDNAPVRGTLLPIDRGHALLSGGAMAAAFNLEAVRAKVAPPPPNNVLASKAREYLRIAGKNIFFGPVPQVSEEVAPPVADDDISQFIKLTSIVGYEDGNITAVFRDLYNNHNYIVEQSPKGALTVRGVYELEGRLKPLAGEDYNYSDVKSRQVAEIRYGTAAGQNQKVWRVRRITTLDVYVEQVDRLASGEKPKPSPLGFVGGGAMASSAMTEGKMFKVSLGQSLAAPTKLLSREAWSGIYAPLVTAPVEGTKPVSDTTVTDRGR